MLKSFRKFCKAASTISPHLVESASWTLVKAMYLRNKLPFAFQHALAVRSHLRRTHTKTDFRNAIDLPCPNYIGYITNACRREQLLLGENVLPACSLFLCLDYPTSNYGGSASSSFLLRS